MKNKIGIMGALPEEIANLIPDLEDRHTSTAGMREYHEGRLWGNSVVVVFSRWGKVASASTASYLISKYNVGSILFMGVAGGVPPDLRTGDIVIGTTLYQHDMDARPIRKRHEIPMLGLDTLSADEDLTKRLQVAADLFIRLDFDTQVPDSTRSAFHITLPRVRAGRIASGDQFFASREKVEELRQRVPETLCVEMEGAAVAQVCHEHRIPFAIARTISDSADEDAPINFQKFINQVARVYSHGIVKRFLKTG